MSVKVAKVIDPRIEPQPDPVFLSTLGPIERAYYYLPASAKGDDYVGWNNIVTRGILLAYGNTFVVILTAQVKLYLKNAGAASVTIPRPNDFIFRDFPLNRCCNLIRVNVNGMSFFSNPMYDIDYKQAYWDQNSLAESFGNTTPCNKPWMSTESDYCWAVGTKKYAFPYRCQAGGAVNTMLGNAAYATGPAGCCNNWIIPDFPSIQKTVAAGGTDTTTFDVTWIEPIFCTPFASRYDQTTMKALYNMGSLEIAMNLRSLKNMLRTANDYIEDYEIHISSAVLRYEVLTPPPSFPIPDYTVTPYRKTDYFITDYPSNPVVLTDINSPLTLTMTSNVFTFNTIPQAIAVFVGTSKENMETSPKDGWPAGTSYGYNKLAFPIQRISISMANTTQILETADQQDLYRIAKRNGYKASFESFSRPWMYDQDSATKTGTGVGSYLRLIPGTDIILPDQQLIPGANADNMVFQITVTFTVPATLPPNYRNIALWLLFEYVGVAKWNATTGTTTLNPLGDGAAMDSAPVVSTSELPENSGTTDTAAVEGSGWLDKIKNVFSKVNNWAKKTGVVSKTLDMIPQASSLASAARKLGYGYPPSKRPRVEGGAVMGLGDFV